MLRKHTYKPTTALPDQTFNYNKESYADLHVAYGEQIIMILNLTFANLNADGGLPSYGRGGELLNRVLFDSTGVKGLFVSKERREDLASETMFALV